MVKADGCAELLRLLRGVLGADLDAAGYTDLDAADDVDDPDLRHAKARAALTAATTTDAALYDHPLLRLRLAGRDVYLEPDLVALRLGGRYHVVEVKSFPVIDGRADPAKVAAAAIQAAVYVLALRDLLGRPDAVSHEIVLVCPENFSNRPVAVAVDVRRQLTVLAHQIARLVRVESILDGLPDGLTLDLRPDGGGAPTRSPTELAEALGTIGARYSPGCLQACEIAYFCRDESVPSTAALGIGVREDLGGVETVDEVLRLAGGCGTSDPDRAEVAAMLRTVGRVYAEATGPGAGAVWTEERRERSDWSDEGRQHRESPGARASGASAIEHSPGAGAVWTEERRERSDWSDEGRQHRESPGARASGASAIEHSSGP
jgi:hypothetical protein